MNKFHTNRTQKPLFVAAALYDGQLNQTLEETRAKTKRYAENIRMMRSKCASRDQEIAATQPRLKNQARQSTHLFSQIEDMNLEETL